MRKVLAEESTWCMKGLFPAKSCELRVEEYSANKKAAIRRPAEPVYLRKQIRQGRERLVWREPVNKVEMGGLEPPSKHSIRMLSTRLVCA